MAKNTTDPTFIVRLVAHVIFDIGDASRLPDEHGVSGDHADKKRWLRHYTNKLAEVIDQYRAAMRR